MIKENQTRTLALIRNRESQPLIKDIVEASEYQEMLVAHGISGDFLEIKEIRKKENLRFARNTTVILSLIHI